MRVGIGSTSQRKIEVVRKVFMEYFADSGTFEFVGFEVKSGVGETPHDKETYDGASTRARAVLEHGKIDLALGLESGLVERYGNLFEEAWCVIMNREGHSWLGYSSGLVVPQYVKEKMNEEQKPHWLVMSTLEEQHGKLPNDTWGSYTGGVLLREVSLEEAIRNAVVQIVAPEHSFFKKHIHGEKTKRGHQN